MSTSDPKYVDEEALKALLTRLAKMYNTLTSFTSYRAGDGIIISDDGTISIDEDWLNEKIQEYIENYT